MTIEETVKNTPMEKRPLLNRNGVTTHMTDEQYTEYLRAQEEMAQMPPPSSEPTVAELAQLLEQERQRGDQLQAQIDALLEGRTGA